MALQWDWKEKCGTATLVQNDADGAKRKFTLSLYTGNAFLIILHEFEEDGVNKYNLYSFWSDKDHMKNCLGLNKKQGFDSNLYEQEHQYISKFRINKTKCRHYADIIAALAQAFKNITIEVYGA